jgi:hypothetical protein
MVYAVVGGVRYDMAMPYPAAILIGFKYVIFSFARENGD